MKKRIDGDEILELYDGQMADAADKKLIADNVPELRYSARGKELFALSESLYGRWLEEGADVKLVGRAIEYCRAAVEQGYPHAVVKMAFYYDKDYVSADRTEEFRCRVACDYYCKVIYCESKPKNTDGVIPEIEWEDLQRLAAKMLLDMLATAPRTLSDYGNGRYSYEYNLKRINSSFGITGERNAQYVRAERNRALFAETVFGACKTNKTRAPLFGVIYLSRDDINSVFKRGAPTMKLCGDLNVWLSDGEKVTRVNNTTAFAQYLKAFAGEGAWAYFFNNNLGGHRYLNGKQRKTLCELMMCDNFLRFSHLTDSAKERGRSEYLFSDDDVRFFLTGRLGALKTALDNLIEFVVSDSDWSDYD